MSGSIAGGKQVQRLPQNGGGLVSVLRCHGVEIKIELHVGVIVAKAPSFPAKVLVGIHDPVGGNGIAFGGQQSSGPLIAEC